VIPEKMQLRNAFLLREGEAVLDLAVDAGLTFGSDEELSIVAALVDTTLQNVAETSRVRILINGEPAETLGGHVDLTRPLLYIRSAIEPPAAVTPAPTP
jgi:spore germination protein GerM